MELGAPEHIQPKVNLQLRRTIFQLFFVYIEDWGQLSFLQFGTSAEFRHHIVWVPSVQHQWMVFKPTGCFELDPECKSIGIHMWLGNNPNEDIHCESAVSKLYRSMEPNHSLSALKGMVYYVCLVPVFVLWESESILRCSNFFFEDERG